MNPVTDKTSTDAGQGRNGLPRVAIVAASLEVVGGQSIEAALLAEALRADGYEITLVPQNPWLPKALRWVRKFRVARTFVNQFFYLPTLVRLARADVVHVFSASYWSFLLAPASAMLVARLFRKQVVLHYHSGEAADHLANWGWAVHPWLSLPHHIVVPSEYLQRVFAEHGHRTLVIANFIKPERFNFRERARLSPRLVSTRNLEPHYAVDTAVRAFAEVKRKYPNATLTLVGAGSEFEVLRTLVQTLGVKDVRFVGQVAPNRIPEVLSEADIFVNGSTIDNQPLSLLEAFASGVPVVSTPTGGIPEIVRDGQTGLLVPASDPGAMTTAILSLLERPEWALELTRRARGELDRFVWPVVRLAWADVYGCREIAVANGAKAFGRTSASSSSVEG